MNSLSELRKNELERQFQEVFSRAPRYGEISDESRCRAFFLAGCQTEGEAVENLQCEIGQWQDSTFPDATALSKMSHLGKEVLELNAALENGNDVGTELADCQHLLFGIASKCGLNLYEETRKKFEINKKRKWGKPDENGVVEHLDEKISNA